MRRIRDEQDQPNSGFGDSRTGPIGVLTEEWDELDHPVEFQINYSSAVIPEEVRSGRVVTRR